MFYQSRICHESLIGSLTGFLTSWLVALWLISFQGSRSHKKIWGGGAEAEQPFISNPIMWRQTSAITRLGCLGVSPLCILGCLYVCQPFPFVAQVKLFWGRVGGYDFEVAHLLRGTWGLWFSSCSPSTRNHLHQQKLDKSRSAWHNMYLKSD